MLVAAVQFKPEFKDKNNNLRKLGKLTLEACKKGAEIIVLPELSVTGYSFMSKKDAEPFAEIIPSKSITFKVFQSLAIRYGTNIAYGIVEKSEHTGNLHNTQVFVCADGSYETYRKINPFGNDFLWMTPGKANPPIRRITDRSGKNHKVGLLVCRDVRDKGETDREFYEVGDADIVCMSANWGNGGFPATVWVEFVKDNNSALIVSNRYGIETPNNFGEGGVCVISKDGKIQCDGLVWGQDCIVYGVA